MPLIVGTAENDDLSGDVDNSGFPYPEQDTIIGLDGDDTLYGGWANDSLVGGAGADNLYGGADHDTLDGGTENDTLIGFEGNDSLIGGAGDDSLHGGLEMDTLDGGTGSNSLTGGSDADVFAISIGGDNTLTDFSIAEGDRIDVSALRISDFTSILDVTYATATGINFIFTGFADGTRVSFETGSESLSAENFIFWTNPDELILGGDTTADSLFGDAGNDTMQGLGGNDTLDGGANDDILQGGAGNDSLIGGTGNDTLDGGAGSNQLVGGEGADVFIVNRGGTDTVTGFSAAEGDRIDLSGLGVSEFESVQSLLGNMTNGTLVFVGGNDSARMLLVNVLRNQLTAQQFVFDTSTTNDVLIGNALIRETMFGGLSNDTLEAAGGSDVLFGEGGDDVLRGSPETGAFTNNQQLFGGSGNDTLFGTQAGNLFGGSGDDVIILRDGTATAFGGTGADIFRLGETASAKSMNISDFRAFEGDRIDVSTLGFTDLAEVIANSSFDSASRVTTISRTIDGEIVQFQVSNLNPTSFNNAQFIFALIPDEVIVGDDTTADNLSGGAGNDTLLGFGGNDTLDGGADNDSLLGGAGDDSLIGGAGNDTLDGGPGRNSLTGGTGADVFAVSLGGITTITDFSIADGDKLDLSALGISDLETFYALAEDPFGQTFLSVTTIGGVRTQVIIRGINESDLGNHLLFSSDATDDLITTASPLSETLIGGLGNDTLQAAGATHFLFGEDGNDLITLMNGSVMARGGAGADTFRVEGIEGDSYLSIDDFSSFEGDRIDVSALGILDFAAVMANGTMDGKSATITFTISGATHTIVLTDVRLSDLTASDFIFAPPIGKLFSGSSSADNVVGEAGNDTLLGRSGNDTMDGAAGDDSLDGGAGNDSLLGGAGDDWLRGGTGQDTLEGGTGDDRLFVDDAGDFVIEVSEGGTDRVYSSIGYTLANGAHVETLSTTSQAGLTAINLVGNNFSQLIIGNAGINWLFGGGGDDRLYGLAGDDRLDGGDGSDRLVGGDGNDSLFGGDGGDRMIGGLGDDTYYVDNVADRITEAADQGSRDRVFVEGLASFTLRATQSIEVLSAIDESAAAMNLTGNDLSQSITGNGGVNILRGLGGDDIIRSEAGNDTLFGGDGNDILDGGTGSDRMTGGAGNDTYTIDAQGDRVIEYAGQGRDTVLVTGLSSFTLHALWDIETLSAANPSGTEAMTLIGNDLSQFIYGNAGENVLRGAGGDDNLLGLAGNDQLFGGDGNDTLIGDTGSDRMNGGSGDDILRGGAGADTLTGGLGADTFVFQTAVGGTEVDHITDFAVEDRIALFNSVFTGIAHGTLEDAALEVNESGVAINGSTRIVYESDTGRLLYDADGSGDTAGVHFATLNASIDGLNAADFLIL